MCEEICEESEPASSDLLEDDAGSAIWGINIMYCIVLYCLYPSQGGVRYAIRRSEV